MNSVADVWDNVLSQLKGELSETTIATWFDELEAVDIQGNTFILHCSNDFKKGYIESLFMKNIKASLHDIFSTDFEVKILDDLDYAELKDNCPHRQSERFTSAEFTFETFVVGPSNKLAYAASVSVAEHPAQNYNPLLIYGDSGLGKTHLIYAIANVIRRNDPRSKIAYVKGDDLTNELVDAIREGKTAEMREKYRQADLLLVDDVQFIAGKKQTQEEFFHTFNTLYESGRQIVLTSDRPPSEMTQLEDRLRTRFEWGLLVDVAPPDFETRLEGTVRDNLLMGKPDASDSELWEVLERVNLADFVRNEKGLDTGLSEKASNLSGGQCQRLALARALLHDSPIYIFDEATSNIDVESENDIMNEIQNLAESKTVILISHRLVNVVKADAIYVMVNGKIAESGKHRELLENKADYEKLWEAQQRLENYGKDGAVQ